MSYDKMHQDMLDSQNRLNDSIQQLIGLMGQGGAQNTGLAAFNGKPGTSAATTVVGAQTTGEAQTADAVTTAALDKAAKGKGGRPPKAKVDGTKAPHAADPKTAAAMTAPPSNAAADTPLFERAKEAMFAVLDTDEEAAAKILVPFMPADFTGRNPKLSKVDPARLQEVLEQYQAFLANGETPAEDEDGGYV